MRAARAAAAPRGCKRTDRQTAARQGLASDTVTGPLTGTRRSRRRRGNEHKALTNSLRTERGNACCPRILTMNFQKLLQHVMVSRRCNMSRAHQLASICIHFCVTWALPRLKTGQSHRAPTVSEGGLMVPCPPWI